MTTIPGLTDAQLAAEAHTLARLQRFVSVRVKSQEDAEEVFQDVLLRLVLASQKQEIQNIGGWLQRASRNAIVDYYRSRKTEVLFGDSDSPSNFADPFAESPGDSAKELATCLTPMIEQLPEHYKKALQLVELEGKSQIEAARLAGVSVPAMKSRVQRGRKLLRQMVLECCEVSTNHLSSITAHTCRNC